MTLLFIKSKLHYKEVNISIIIVSVIHNKLANSIIKIILSNNIANNVVVIIAVI